MSEYANLWLYFLLVFGVIILPGMDMAFVMSSSMTGGRRVGLAAQAMQTLADKPKAGAYAARSVGVMLILASIVTVWRGIRSL